MELAQEKLDLIEKIIRNDKKFVNNEDLYDDFFNETCKRSCMIVKTVASDVTLEAYLRKIAKTSILNVLKNEGRLRRSKGAYISNKEESLDSLIDSSLVDYSKCNIHYRAVKIQDTPEDVAIKKDILQVIVDTVYELDETFPEENYAILYNLRFEKGLTQKEIAKRMNLSQSEVSKRLFKLMHDVKQAFN